MGFVQIVPFFTFLLLFACVLEDESTKQTLIRTTNPDNFVAKQITGDKTNISTQEKSSFGGNNE